MRVGTVVRLMADHPRQVGAKSSPEPLMTRASAVAVDLTCYRLTTTSCRRLWAQTVWRIACAVSV